MTADLTLSCRDCGQSFVFTVREQEFFAERGFGNPVRCLTCRRAHKAKRMGGQEEGAPPPGLRSAGAAPPLAPRHFEARPPRGPEGRDGGREFREFRPQRDPAPAPAPAAIPPPVYSAPREEFRESRRPEPAFADSGGDPWEDRGRSKKKKEKRGGRPRYEEDDGSDY